MATPAEQLAQILQQAISNALQENKDLFTQSINITDTGSGGGGGGGGADLLGTVLGLVGLGLLATAEFEPLFTALTAAEDAAGAQGTSFTVGWFLASTLLQFATPITRQVNHAIEAAVTSQIYDPITAADLAARGIITTDFGASEAGGGGFDAKHFAGMLQAAYNYPALAEVLNMWNRGYLQESDVDQLLTLNGIPPQYQDSLKLLRRELLTPADLALAALRQNITVEQGIERSALWGLDEEGFTVLMGNTGEPPGTMQMLEAYRRGFIDRETLVKGILQSRVRDEWIPTIEKLRYAPMSTAEAANAVTRGYISYDEGASIAQQNGLEPDHWNPLYLSNGRPPSHTQLGELWLRGIITRDQYAQGIRESDIKDKYINDVIDLTVKFMPLFEARTLLNAGEITGKVFAEQLTVQGYQPSVIKEILSAVGSGKGVTVKHLTASDYTDLYDAGAMNRTDTLHGLTTIGYTEADAETIVTVAETKSQAKLVATLITNIRTQFDRFKLDTEQARAELDKLGVQPAERDRLVQGWEIVRPQGTKTLTEAQTLKALKDGAITVQDCYMRLRGLGLDDVDAKLLMEVDG